METIIKFDPDVADLQAIVAQTSQIIATDLSDEKQLKIVKKNRISLRDARIGIEKKGKELRDGALKYQRDVIAREKELIAIIEPEEQRLKQIEAEAERIKVREERKASLSMRHEQLAAIGDGVHVDDEFLLGLDTEEFVLHMNERKAAKFDADSKALEKEKAQIEQNKLLAEAEERGRQRELQQQEIYAQRKIDEAKHEAARIEREAREKVAREDRERKAKAELAVQEEKRMLKAKKNQEWLTSIGYKKEEKDLWIFQSTSKKISAYKLIASFDVDI